MKLLALLGLGIALAAGNNETIWWRTNGGTVIEFRDTKECSLLLYDNEHGVVFSWLGDTQRIAVQDDRIHVADGQTVPVSVEVGDTSLGVLSAIGINGDFASAAVSQPLEQLLRSADKISFQFANVDVQYTVNRQKMPGLLDGVKKCRRK